MGVVVERRRSLLEDPGDLVEQIVDDLYLRTVPRTRPPCLPPGQALPVARAALANPDTPLVPSADDSAARDFRPFAEQRASEFQPAAAA